MSRLIIAGLLSLASALAWGVVGPGGGGSGGGSGTVSSGNSGEYACYASSGTVVSGCAAPASTSGLSMGQIAYKSGANTIGGVTIGSGLDFTAGTLSATGGSFSASSTSTLTNKTYDTAGTGNSFSINGVAVTANTGTGGVVRATAPTVDLPKVTSYTWSGKPAAASYSGAMITISDVGLTGAGSLWVSNGTRWVPVNGSIVLCSLDTAGSNATSTIARMGGCSLPAGLWAEGDRLRVRWTAHKSSTADTCDARMLIGTAADTNGDALKSDNSISASTDYMAYIFDLRRDADSGATAVIRRLGTGAGAPYSGAITADGMASVNLTSNPTSVAQYINFTIRRSAGTTETCYLDDYAVELVVKAN